MVRSPPASDVKAAQQAMERVRVDWLTRSGVNAIDVGFKIRDGRVTDEVAVRVHLSRKLPPEAVPRGELFPERLGLIAVDIIEGDYAPQTAPAGG